MQIRESDDIARLSAGRALSETQPPTEHVRERKRTRGTPSIAMSLEADSQGSRRACMYEKRCCEGGRDVCVCAG
jgi:hypothetical protein